MSGLFRRSLAAAVFGSAALFAGVSLSNAQEGKAPDLADLRDAVKAADKRGENVDEVARALAALEQALAKGVAGGPGKPAPPELVALRDAVDAAARKGENVEAIRKELEAVEKAITGQALARPKPAPPPPLPDPAFRPQPQPRPLNDPFLPEFPNFPDLGGLDPNNLKMAQDLLQKALGGGLGNPGGNADGLKDLQQALEAFRKAALLGEELGLPEFANPAPRLPAADKARLGIRMERLNPIVVEQLGLDQGRGISVVAVVGGSPAEKAGLKANDIVLEFAGKPVTDDPADLARRVNEVKAGEKVDLVVLRKGKKVEVKGVELNGPPAARNQPAPQAPNLNNLPQFKEIEELQKLLQKGGGLPNINPLQLPGLPGFPGGK